MKHYAGSLDDQPSGLKHALFFWLTRFPPLYLFLERRRRVGNWDKRIYLGFVRRGDIVLDIGANYGGYTIFLSNLVGRRGRVIAFEPVPASFAALQDNLERRARFPNITTFQLAVGNPNSREEVAVMRVPGDDFGQASLAIHTAGSWAGASEVSEYEVPITSVDADPATQNLSRLDFVKIDVEGGELNVLKGAARTLSRHRPMLYCEVERRWAETFGYSPDDLLEFIRSLGYTDARVITGERMHSHRLGDPLPTAWFDSSANVLFLTPKHKRLAERFDRRFLETALGPS